MHDSMVRQGILHSTQRDDQITVTDSSGQVTVHVGQMRKQRATTLHNYAKLAPDAVFEQPWWGRDGALHAGRPLQVVGRLWPVSVGAAGRRTVVATHLFEVADVTKVTEAAWAEEVADTQRAVSRCSPISADQPTLRV